MGWVRALVLLWLGIFHASAGFAQERSTLATLQNPRVSHGGWVSDVSHVLGPRAAQIEQLASALNRATGAEVAIVIAPDIDDPDVRAFATALFARWGIGRRGHDDGVLVLHVLGARRLEIEVGYGLEAALPDIKCAWLIESVRPLLRAGDFGAAHLALLRGIDHAIRQPEATREALLAAAVAEATPAQAAPASARAARSKPLLLGYDVAFGVLGGLCVLAWALRVWAQHALERGKKRREGARWGLWLCALLTALAPLVTAHVADFPEAVWASLVALGALALYTGVRAFKVRGRARIEQAPRLCSSCGSTMRRVKDAKDDVHLTEGQRAEERMHAVDYHVYLCSCGNKQVEQYAGHKNLQRCPACSYQTEELKREKTLRPATETAEGLAERYFHCGHCKAQRSEQLVLRKLVRAASASGPKSSRPRSSSSSSSKSRSFGGGRSGGGGAGGSY